MKYCAHPLVTLVLISCIFAVTGADSLRRSAIDFVLASHFVVLVNTSIPPLNDFTLCVDINVKTGTGGWNVFSYRDPDNNNTIAPGMPDLSWYGTPDSLTINYLGNKFEFNFVIELGVWQSLCSVWDSSHLEMELYENGRVLTKDSVFTPHNNVMRLTGNGSLALGINHIKNNGVVQSADRLNFLGTIYNFQMWNYKRSPASLTDCARGNLVNWTSQFWQPHRSRFVNDDRLRCANAEEEPTTASTTTQRTTHGADSLRRRAIDFISASSYVVLVNTSIPPLNDFTLCVDINRKPGTGGWNVFSYRDPDNNNTIAPGMPDLSWFGTPDSLTINYLGNKFEFNFVLQVGVWQSLCSVWDSSNLEMELYENGRVLTKDSVFTQHNNIMQLTGNGSLALGINHIKNNGVVQPADRLHFLGTIYNFQMWNYKRSPASLTDCASGNLVNWKSRFWQPHLCRLVDDDSLRCANAEEEPTTASTTTQRTTHGTSASTLPLRSTTSSTATTTTTRKPQSESGSTATYKTYSSASTSTNVTSSKEYSTGGSSTKTNAITTTLSSTSTTTTTTQEPQNMPTTTLSLVDITTNESRQNTSLPKSPSPPHSGHPSNTLSTKSTPRTSANLPLPQTSAHVSTTVGSPSVTKSSISSTIASTSTTTTVLRPSVTNSYTSTTKASTSATTITVGRPSVTKPSTSTTITSTSTTITTTVGSLSATKPSKSTTMPTTSTFTTTMTNDSSNTKLPTSTINSTTQFTYFVVLVDITFFGSNGVIDDDTATNMTKLLLDELLKNTEFTVLQISLYNGPSNELWKVPSQSGTEKWRQNNDNSVDINNESKAVIQATSTDGAEPLGDKLKELLEKEYYFQGDFTLNITVNSVEFVVPGSCPRERTFSSDKGYHTWMETNPSEIAMAQCALNPNTFGTRYCNVNIKTAKAEWEPPDLERCPSFEKLPDSILDLEGFEVTPANARYLAMHISNLTHGLDVIPVNETEIILDKLYEIVRNGESDVSTAQTTLDIINSIVQKGKDTRLFTNRILNLTEEIGFHMNFPGETANITAETLALSVSSVNFTDFENLSFTVKSYMEGSNPEITLQKVPVDEAVAFINLPRAIKDHISTENSKVQFNFFGNIDLFKEDAKDILISYVVSASVEGTQIQDLDEPAVTITLKHHNWPQKEGNYEPECAFWDFQINGSQGGWNTNGCKVNNSNVYNTTCQCSHLTHFGVLLDISRSGPVDDPVLSLLTYVGCGIASIFLGIALVTYGLFKQLRRDYPSKILINLCFALIMVNLIFLVNSWLSSFGHYGICISSAALLHYFLLASFTWMGLEAVHMYFAFVKVFNLYIHNYVLKFCIAGWGIPAVIVAIVLGIDLDFYGSYEDKEGSATTPDDSDLFCWIQNDLVFYLTVVTYFCVIFLTNISMFIVVLIQINSLKFKRRKDWKAFFLHDLKSTLSLAFLLGLTWGFAFFAWGPVRMVFLYLFAIFNTLQGFFIFVFHCLIKENVRKQWKMHLCCGKYGLDNYSDWSRISNADAKPNGRIRTSPSDSFQSNTTASTSASTSNSSSLSGFTRADYTGRSYSNGGIYINPAHLEPQYQPQYQPNMHPNTRKTLMFLNLNIQ